MKKTMLMLAIMSIIAMSGFGQSNSSVDSTIQSNRSSAVGINSMQSAKKMKPYQHKQSDSSGSAVSGSNSNGSGTANGTSNNGTVSENKDPGSVTEDPNKDKGSSNSGAINSGNVRKKGTAKSSGSNGTSSGSNGTNVNK